MTEHTSYLTVARSATAEIQVRRSRFLCRVERVTSEQAARTVVEEQRRRHRDARHHCSAWVLGPEARVQHSNDDGEPPGTAGGPMLEVLRGRPVTDVVAVVSRYFGGVLLGSGGLVRAYAQAVREALDEAGVRQRRLMARFDVDVPVAEAGRVEHALRAHGITVTGAEYAHSATLHLVVMAQHAPDLPRLLSELSGGTLDPRPTGSGWVDS